MSEGQSGGGAPPPPRQLHRELELDDRLADDAGVVGELIFDEAAREPHQPGVHAVGIEEGPRHVEQADSAVGRTEAAGRADLAAGVKTDRHRDFDRVGLGAVGIVAEHDQHVVEREIAELLLALSALLGLGADQRRVFENLQVRRHGRLRKRQRAGDVVDVDAGTAVQQPQHADPLRRGERAQDFRPLLGVDHQEIARHGPLSAPLVPSVYIKFPDIFIMLTENV
jgi:hypothetical protein